MLFRKLQLSWRYGISELLIVVAGVMIALYADGWMEERQNRALELEYVERLIEDLQLDTAAVSNIATLSQERAQYARVVLDAYDTGTRSVSPADFARAVEYAGYFSYPSYSTRTIDDLMSTGNLRLIRSTEVRDAISTYYAQIEWTEQFRQLIRPIQLSLAEVTPEVLGLDHRYALFQEGISVSCGPTLRCSGGIPWGPDELVVSETEANAMLERLLARPDARPIFASMARQNGGHYSNLTGIYRVASDALTVLEEYREEGW